MARDKVLDLRSCSACLLAEASQHLPEDFTRLTITNGTIIYFNDRDNLSSRACQENLIRGINIVTRDRVFNKLNIKAITKIKDDPSGNPIKGSISNLWSNNNTLFDNEEVVDMVVANISGFKMTYAPSRGSSRFSSH